MKSAFWGYWLIILGVFVVVVMLLVNNITTANTQNYMTIKEVSEASIIEAVDLAYYRQYGEIKINKEKFMENFIRRLAEVGNRSTTYNIEFFDIVEAPPKISLQVSSKSNTFNIAGDITDFDIVDKIDAVLEGKTIK
jgi:hypothetical protein